tara:strand:+ start:946 stop:2088 length:1143 start_codon:yes stop_codon:yes gene_type:complete
MSILVNPAVVFSLSWFSVLLGMQVKWSDLIVETPFILTVTIYSTIVSSLMAFIVVRYLLPRKKRLNFVAPISNDMSFSGVGVLSTILVTGHLFELLLEGNLPLFSLFFGKYILYADYGISGLHGFLNAIQLYIFIISFYRYLKHKDRTSMKICFALMVLSILMLSRAMILWQILQAIFLYLALNQVNFRRFLKLSIYTVITMGFFILIGNSRVKEGFSITSIAQINENYPSILTEEFIWIYLYLTSPFNNIANSIANFEAARYFPFNTLLFALPNVVKGSLGLKADNMVLTVDDNLNVASYLDTFLPDFGFTFTWFAIFIVFFGFSLIYRKARFNDKFVILNSVACSMAFFSVFTNTFTTLILLIEISLLFFLVKRKLVR